MRVEFVRGGDVHALGDRRVWSPLVAVVESEGAGPEFRLSIEMRNGVPEVREVTVLSVGTGRAIRPIDLRVKLDQLVEDAISEAALLASVPTAGDWRDTPLGRRELAADPNVFDDMVHLPGDDAERRATAKLVQQAARRPRRKKVDDELLLKVAEVYRANVDDRPTQAVREHFQVKPSTASWYVRQARDAGHLGPAAIGKAGEQ